MPLLDLRTRLRSSSTRAASPPWNRGILLFAAGYEVTGGATEIDQTQIVSSIRVLILQNVQER